MRVPLGFLAIAGLLAVASPARALAQWTRVTPLPATDIFSIWAEGDTIAAGADTVAYLSVDGGTTWKKSVRIVAGATAVQGVRVKNGRTYAGTYGQGVFVSDDLGDTWTARNQGLVGGIANAQLFVIDLLIVRDSLYAATSGAGPWVRRLSGASTWGHFGDAFEPNQASNMNGIAHGGTRFVAAAGFNGTVFFREQGQPDWTLSWLNNTGSVPGLAALATHWTGAAWLVGSNVGLFRNTLGQSPWDFTDLGFGTLFGVSFVQRGGETFAAFGYGGGTAFERSIDGGATWELLDDLPFTFTYGMAMSGNTLYAARLDGLWRRDVAAASVPPPAAAQALRFAIAGRQPVGDAVRFTFELPEAGAARIEIFDVAGRAIARIEDATAAGPREMGWSTRGLAPGVYVAKLSAAGRTATLRLVRTR